MTREQIFDAILTRYTTSDLDSHVIELKNCEASEINNAGIDWLAQALLHEYA